MSRVILFLAALAAALVVSAPAASAASVKSCPKRANTIASNKLSRVWHQQGAVYACTTVYAHKPRAKRMGPWTKRTKLALSGDSLLWTTRTSRGGAAVDRVWGASIDAGARWVSGARLVPASGDEPAREAKAAKLLVADRSAAWLTTDGDVVMALVSPNDDPSATGVTLASLPKGQTMLLVGSFPDADVSALGGSMSLEEGDGEGDECGGVNPYTLAFTPDPATSATASVVWSGDWTSTNCS